MLTEARLREKLIYYPITGRFRWRDTKEEAGSLRQNGYVCIGIDYKRYQAHQLVFLLEDGEFPAEDVDHINGNRADNSRENLRKVSRSQNLMNRKPNLNKDIQVKNVYLHKPSGRYRVKMKVDGVTKHFGYFDDLEAASFVAKQVQEKYHGEYARTPV